MKPRAWSAAALLTALLACSSANPVEPSAHCSFDFADGQQGWIAGFADYPAGQETFYELTSDYRDLPAPLDAHGSIFISGNNHSDDLFMYIKRRITGLEPLTRYAVALTVSLATNVPSGCAGVGGAAGESVYLKAGASTAEPVSVQQQSGYLLMNIDKGNQSQRGENAAVLGDVANSIDCESGIPRYEIKELSSPPTVQVTTDQSGSAWILVGTDSGFEAVTALYYTRVVADFVRQ